MAVLLLLYQAFFLNVVVPGHTRGAITMDGRHTADGGCPSCCCCGSAGDSASTAHKSRHAPSQRDRENCSICNFAARVTAAPVLNLKLPELDLLEVLPVAPPLLTTSARALQTYYGRGPPA